MAGRPLNGPQRPLTVTNRPRRRRRSPPLEPACQQRRSPLAGAGQPRAQDGAGGGGCRGGGAMLGFLSGRQAGLDEPLRLRRAEATRR